MVHPGKILHLMGEYWVSLSIYKIANLRSLEDRSDKIQVLMSTRLLFSTTTVDLDNPFIKNLPHDSLWKDPMAM